MGDRLKKSIDSDKEILSRKRSKPSLHVRPIYEKMIGQYGEDIRSIASIPGFQKMLGEHGF
jgi:hypothetical protein